MLVSYKPATASYAVVIFKCRTDDSRIGPGTGPWQTLRLLGGAPDGSVVSNCILGEDESEIGLSSPLEKGKKRKEMQDLGTRAHVHRELEKTSKRDEENARQSV